MSDKEKNFVSAVVYINNAENSIGLFMRRLIGVFENNFEHSEIICVNDNSFDKSVDEIKEASKVAASTSVSVVNMSHFHGMELAMNAGVSLSIGDFVFEFDHPYMDYDEQIIMDVYRKSMEGFDIVSAVPDKKERLSSRLFYRVFDKFTDLSYKMHTESFRILSRRVINRIESMNKTVPYRKALYANQGLSTVTITYKSQQTSAIKKMNKQEKGYRFGLAMDTLILFTEMGYSFAIAMTLLMMLVSVFMVIYSVVVYIIDVPVAGWTTTILFLSVAFFGLFAILTIIIKYLQLLVDLVFKRKQYSFSSIDKLTK